MRRPNDSKNEKREMSNGQVDSRTSLTSKMRIDEKRKARRPNKLRKREEPRRGGVKSLRSEAKALEERIHPLRKPRAERGKERTKIMKKEPKRRGPKLYKLLKITWRKNQRKKQKMQNWRSRTPLNPKLTLKKVKRMQN